MIESHSSLEWLSFLSRGCRQCPQIEHNLPALQLREFAERWHSAAQVSVRDLPEQCAIALLLNNRQLQISRVPLFHSGAVFAVALDTIANEKLASASRGFRFGRQWI